MYTIYILKPTIRVVGVSIGAKGTRRRAPEPNILWACFEGAHGGVGLETPSTIRTQMKLVASPDIPSSLHSPNKPGLTGNWQASWPIGLNISDVTST